MKKFLAILLTALMVLALGTAALAQTARDGEPTSGSITITNATPGETYKIYKLFDATYDGDNVSYTFKKTAANTALYNALTATGSPFVLTLKSGTTDEYVVTLVSPEPTDTAIIDFIKAIPAAAIEGAFVDQKVCQTGATTVEFTGLDFGYYYVTSTLGAGVTITNVTPNATVVDKNQTPHFDDQGKYMLINNERVYINTANVGQQIDFVIPIDAVNYVNGEVVTKYTVTDTMPTGITLLDTTLQVKVNGTALAATAYTITWTPATGTPKTGFSIEIPWATQGQEEGALWTPIYNTNQTNTIEVTYSGIVNEQIGMSTGNTLEPAVNQASFDYTTDHNNHFPEGDVPHSETTTYSTGITLEKVDGSDHTEKLQGAKFSIDGTSYGISIVNQHIYVLDNENGTYYMLKDGTYTTSAPTEATADLYDDPTGATKYTLVDHVGTEFTATPVHAEGYVDTNGHISFTGLGAGIYTITELESPDGYNLLAAPIYVEVRWVEETVDNTDPENPVTTPAHFEYYQCSDNTGANPVAFNPAQFQIENNSGSSLPETGGIGTKIFYIVGGLLMATAVVLLVTRKKMSATEE